MKWYKRDPNAYFGGTRTLTLEQRGAYNDIIELLYMRDGDLPDDDKFIARALNVRPQVWRRIRVTLIAAGKLHVLHSKLTANRVETELVSSKFHSEKMARLGRVSWLKRKEIYDLGLTARSTPPFNAPARDNQISKIHSFFSLPRARATSVDNSETESEETLQGAGDKKASEVSRNELEAIYAAKRPKEGQS